MSTRRRTLHDNVSLARTHGHAVQERARRSLFGTVWERMLETEIIDRSVGLAGKAFTSFFPLVITVAAFLPAHSRMAIVTGLADRFGITGHAYDTVKQAFASPREIRSGAGFIGLVLTLFFASSFTTALERIYLRAWRRPAGSPLSWLGPYVRGGTWVTAFIVYVALLGLAREMLWGGVLTVLFCVVALALSTAVWWFTTWMMLARQVRFRVLIPSGLITGALVSALALSSSLWMPLNVSLNQQQYGLFGVTLALITWFSVAAICIVVGACAGSVLAEDPGPLGTRIRGGKAEVLVDDAAPALPRL